LRPIRAKKANPKITAPPKTRIDQFIDMSVTGIEGGKKENTIEMHRKLIEKRLTKIPRRPTVHGPQEIDDGSRTRLMTRSVMGMR